MIKTKTDALSCLGIALIVATLATWVGVGFSFMGTTPAGQTRFPLWQSALIVTAFFFGTGVGLAVVLVGERHRHMVAAYGVAAAVLIYCLVGFFWWFRV